MRYCTDVSFCRGDYFQWQFKMVNTIFHQQACCHKWCNRNAHIFKSFLRSKDEFQCWVPKNLIFSLGSAVHMVLYLATWVFLHIEMMQCLQIRKWYWRRKDLVDEWVDWHIMLLGIKLIEIRACTFTFLKAQRYTIALNATLFFSLEQAEELKITTHSG